MGKRLRKIRKENAPSQDDVADALGICTKQYQRYEYGDSVISCEKLSILEESFHFDVRYIVTRKREQIDIDRSWMMGVNRKRVRCYRKKIQYPRR